MRLATLFRYLIGDREAILQLACNCWSLAVGALLVLSAGLARDYDQEDLLHEPWHLLVPFGASIVASAVLFAVACGPWALARDATAPWPGWIRAYASFLGLFWLTAPLAWLYAIPYERLMTAPLAVGANLTTLAIVAAWRVALMVRVLRMLFNYDLFAAVVMVFGLGDAVLLLAMSFLPSPLLELTSGTKMSEGDLVLFQTAFYVSLIAACSGPLWLVGLFSVYATTMPRWQSLDGWTSVRPAYSVWGMALGAVVLGLMALPFTLPEQTLRRRVETDFKEGRAGDALAKMSAHSPEDFPPLWLPPPRFMSRGSAKNSSAAA